MAVTVLDSSELAIAGEYSLEFMDHGVPTWELFCVIKKLGDLETATLAVKELTGGVT